MFEVVKEIDDLLDGVSSENDNELSSSYSEQNIGEAKHDFMQYLNGNKSQNPDDAALLEVESEINDLLNEVSSENNNTPSSSNSNQNTGNAEHDFMQYLNVPILKQKKLC